MPRWFVLVILFGLGLAQSPLELEAFRLSNEARRAHGLAELAWDDAAYRAARAHALDMLERGFFDHTNPDGQGPADRMWAAGVLEVTVGENLALYEGYPPRQVAEVVVEDWLNSPPHRKNLLLPGFTHLGLALVQKDGRIAVVQNFIARPFNVWFWRTPASKTLGYLRYRGRAAATVGVFVDATFRRALQPPAWQGQLELEPGSTVELGLWDGDRYLLACRFTPPATSCAHRGLTWKAEYVERSVPSVRVQLGLPGGEYWLGYGSEPKPFKAVHGAAVVNVPRSWKFLWVGLSQGDKIEYTHRIPLLEAAPERVLKGERP